MNVLLLILLVLILVVGIALAAFQLPGTWIILVAAVGYDAYFHWQRIGWGWLAALGGIAVAAEILETGMSMAATRRAGASRRASVFAMLGGFIGMIVLSPPLLLVGTILGGLIGCFAGAFIGEMTSPDRSQSMMTDRISSGTRVGVFAAVGRVFGLVAKIGAAIVMAGAAFTLAVIK